MKELISVFQGLKKKFKNDGTYYYYSLILALLPLRTPSGIGIGPIYVELDKKQQEYMINKLDIKASKEKEKEIAKKSIEFLFKDKDFKENVEFTKKKYQLLQTIEKAASSGNYIKAYKNYEKFNEMI